MPISFLQYITEAGASAERQETALVDAVNKSANGSPITVIAGKSVIHNVISAHKFQSRQIGGSEPYTDVVLNIHGGGEINLSLKGETAPSLAGGGLRGLELAVPGIANKFMHSVFNALSKKLKAGDKVPDTYGKIGENDKLKIVVGNKAMGGPIDYMYIGSMDPKFTFNGKELHFTNGKLIPAKEFAHTHELYFRLRARREDQRFDPLAKDSKGTPKIYGKSPSKGDSAGRIVVTDKVPSNANVIDLH
jgi:hypothetical protein